MKSDKTPTATRWSLVTLVAALASPLVAAEWNITGSTFSHDPCVIKEGSMWRQFYTADGIGQKYSSDGLYWNQGTQVFAAPLAWWKTYVPKKTDFNIWAPDVFYYNNRYWLYYSVSTWGSNESCIGLTSCTSISKADWRDDGVVIYSNSSVNYNAIDPGISLDAYGNLWMAFGSFFSGIKLIQLDPSTMKPLSGAPLYSIATRPTVQGNPIESPYIVYANGFYYLFVSFDNCCKGTGSTYKIAYGRATSITGPYVDKSGKSMMEGGGTILEQSTREWKGPGGQSVANHGTGKIMVRHAYKGTTGEATLRIRDLYWDSNYWPTY